MSGFSDDGRWWWNGTTWIPTAQVVLPQLPPTELEQSAEFQEARVNMRKANWAGWANVFAPMAALSGTLLLIYLHRALPVYRLWMLEEVALATAHLLGAEEPMLAGEPALLSMFPEDSAMGVLAVAVTAAHVLVFRLSVDGQPQRLAMVGRSTGVKMELHHGLFGLGGALMVSRESEKWPIRGYPGVSKPELVLDAWRQAANATVRTR